VCASFLSELAERIASAGSLTVLTGAGVSAASGVPTFRGPGGLWRQYRPEALANAEAFARDPRLVWEWYDWRRGLIATCRPNRGHEVLAAWSRRLPRFSLVTQNVDGLHERAGTQSVTRVHGSIWVLKCWNACGHEPEGWIDESVPLDPLPPRCTACGGLARPGVVWFGEALDPHAWAAAERAAASDVFLAVGTSAVVHPAAGLLSLARSIGAFVAEINPERTGATGMADLSLQMPADEALPALEERLMRASGSDHPGARG
jgi:NAD-dependent deacetylase